MRGIKMKDDTRGIQLHQDRGSASWKPRRKGRRFCSPACGRGCTVEEFVKAKGSARRLARRLGKGWKPDVWENLGWYWCAVNRGLKVHPPVLPGTDYTAFMGEPDGPGGRWAEHGKTPRVAVENVIAKATEERDMINACIKAAGGSK